MKEGLTCSVCRSVQRKARCYLDDGTPPRTECDALSLIDRRGFVLLGVDPKIELPNLSDTDESREWSVSWQAWRWKHSLPQKRACAYLKWFRNQGTFISWRLYPCFYSLWAMRSEAQNAFYEGSLSRGELQIMRVIEEMGAISSRDLWRRVRPYFGKRTQFLSALLRLQKAFAIAVSGGEQEGWSMHIWDLVPNIVPEALLDRLPSAEQSVEQLVLQSLDNLVCSNATEIARLFVWTPSYVNDVLEALAQSGRVYTFGSGVDKRFCTLSPPAAEVLERLATPQ